MGGIELVFFSLGRGGLELEWRGTYLPDLFYFSVCGIGTLL